MPGPIGPTIGYDASHEQFPPSALLGYAKLAEQGGVHAGICSDHFAPWSEPQSESGFSFAWLGAALNATSLPFGVVCAPGQRYHPAVVAQAAATLAEMNPARFWLALGSGQAMNEHITGDAWLPKHDRMARLRECADVIRALFAGETVSHSGHIHVDEAKLWTLPAEPPMLVGSAISVETAEWVGGWADALVTVGSTPTEFDDVGEYVRVEDLEPHIRMSADPGHHVEWLRQDIDLGFDALYLHNVGPNQEAFIETFGSNVLPELT